MSRVLVVDDEKSIRDTICAFLVKEGYEVNCAPDAYVALQMLDCMDFDVVLTDIIMPRLSGIELLSSIRKNSQTIQIIIMTGEPTVDTAVKAVRSGANDYLSKPINKESLIKAVKKSAQIKLLHDEKADLQKQNQLYQKTLEEMVNQRTQELLNAMQSIISLLSTVVEVRDPYTAGHQVRVGNLSAAIAQKMNLSDRTVDFLRIIGYIHDIGKIVIPTEILCKPGLLSSLEMQMIRNHPKYGYEMITKVNLPALIGEAIMQHHERCNGSGYPNAIKTGDITIEAQIIMVADVVEAMMSHRPYRPALGLRAALAEIKQNAGILYNPQIVEVCIDLFMNDNYAIDGEEYKICFPI